MATFPTGRQTIGFDVAARCSGWVSVTEKRFAGGARGNGTDDDTDAIRAAIDSVRTAGVDVGVVFFPESPQPYQTDEITLVGGGSADKQIIFAGSSMRGSRIRIKGTTGGYGINFSNTAGNSWGGFRNIRIETSVDLTSVVRVVNPANAFLMERAFISGGDRSDYCITIDGAQGVGFTADWTYTTGATSHNIRAVDLTSGQLVVFNQGNHDVGDTGILSVEAASSSGGQFVFIGGRWELIDGKTLFRFDTQSASRLSVIGSQFVHMGGTATTAIVARASGTARPTWFLDASFPTTPTNIYVDEGNAGNNIAAVANDLKNPILDNAYLHFGSHRVWVDANGRLRKYLGAPSADTSGFGITPRTHTPAASGGAFPIDAGLGSRFHVIPADGSAFTISTPTNSTSAQQSGMEITIHVRNTTGGALGTATWGSGYRLSTWSNPANGYSRSVTFQNDGTNVWWEVSRTPADVPNT